MNLLPILLLVFVTNVFMCPLPLPKTCICQCLDCEFRSHFLLVYCEDIPDLNNFLSSLKGARMKTLTIENCTKPEPNLAKLPPFKVNHIFINNCGIETVPDDAFVDVSRHLKALDLSHNALTKVPLFLNLTEVDKLVLKNNSITEITNTSLASLELLNELDMRYNRLHHISVDAFQHQGKIRELDFGFNELTYLEPGTFKTVNLSYAIMLNNNKLKRLSADTFVGNPEMYKLDLTNNELTELEPGAFNGLDSDMKLLLENNKLTSIEGVFVNMSNLLLLDLSNNSIVHISNTTFNTSSTITFLKLNHNKIRSIDPNALPDGRHFYLDHNEITTVKGAFRKTTDLKILELNDNLISEIGNRDFEGPSDLRSIQLESNPIKYIAMHAFDGIDDVEVNSPFLNKP